MHSCSTSRGAPLTKAISARTAMNGCHALAVGIEGQLMNARIVVGSALLVEAALRAPARATPLQSDRPGRTSAGDPGVGAFRRELLHDNAPISSRLQIGLIGQAITAAE